MKSRCLVTLLAILLPSLALADPLMPIAFRESSSAGARQLNVPGLADFEEVLNVCAGVPLVCGSAPTAASQLYLHTSAAAFTDGFGGSGLSLRSRDGHAEAVAHTLEVGFFEATVPGDVEVHMQGFFPLISLFGIFAPGSQLAYDIRVGIENDIIFETHGVLTDTGFTATGDDVGAVYDAQHHSVVVPAFLLERTSRRSGQFNLFVSKMLTLITTDWAEAVDAKMIDPQGVSAPDIVRGVVADAVQDVPEPALLCLMGVALASCAARNRLRRCK